MHEQLEYITPLATTLVEASEKANNNKPQWKRTIKIFFSIPLTLTYSLGRKSCRLQKKQMHIKLTKNLTVTFQFY